MDRTIVLPYEPTDLSLASSTKDTGNLRAGTSHRSGGTSRLLYIHICTQAGYYWLGEIDLICTTTTIHP